MRDKKGTKIKRWEDKYVFIIKEVQEVERQEKKKKYWLRSNKKQREMNIYCTTLQKDQRVTEVMFHTYDYRKFSLNTPCKTNQHMCVLMSTGVTNCPSLSPSPTLCLAKGSLLIKCSCQT